jgi:hypothetical protein
LQPVEICIQAWKLRSRFSGSSPENVSNVEKWPLGTAPPAWMKSPRRWMFPGPNARSTNGNWSKSSSFIDSDQHPPTTITFSGSRRFAARASMRCATSRSSAFSRMVQVLKTRKSASSAVPASPRPSDSSSPLIRSESCTFIWQPNVVTW